MYLSFFTANMRPATLLNVHVSCFPVNFEKFLRTPFFTEHLWWLLLDRVMNTLLRSSRPYMLFKIDVLKNFAIFTGKHKCWSLFLLKQACKSRNFIKMRLQHWCFFVNVCRIFKNRFFLWKNWLLHIFAFRLRFLLAWDTCTVCDTVERTKKRTTEYKGFMGVPSIKRHHFL